MSQREVFSVAVGCSDLVGHDGCSTGNERDLAASVNLCWTCSFFVDEFLEDKWRIQVRLEAQEEEEEQQRQQRQQRQQQQQS